MPAFTPSSALLHNMIDRAMTRFELDRASYAYTATRPADPLSMGPARVVTDDTRDRQFLANVAPGYRPFPGVSTSAVRTAAELLMGYGDHGMRLDLCTGSRVRAHNTEHYAAVNALKAAGYARTVTNDTGTVAVLTPDGRVAMDRYLGSLELITSAANPRPTPRVPRSLAHRFAR